MPSTLMGRAMRAGHPLSAGFKMVADEAPEPIATEFRQVFEEQRFGLPFDDSLLALGDRVRISDIRILITAILIHRQVGGNLAEVLDNIAALVRERFKLRRQLKVITARDACRATCSPSCLCVWRGDLRRQPAVHDADLRVGDRAVHAGRRLHLPDPGLPLDPEDPGHRVLMHSLPDRRLIALAVTGVVLWIGQMFPAQPEVIRRLQEMPGSAGHGRVGKATP
jgi:hypothetical protein